MSALLLAIVMTAGVGHDHSPDHIHWWKQHLKCRTLVLYGECGRCGNAGTCSNCKEFNYRVEFDYLWSMNRRRPCCSPTTNTTQPVVMPVEELLPEQITPPRPAPGLFD